MMEAAESRPRWQPFALGGAIFVLTIVAMLPAAKAVFTWDDDLWITGNVFLRDSAGLWSIWFAPRSSGNREQFLLQYCPLVLTSFWAEYRIYAALLGESRALDPMGYHVVNMLLQAGCGVMLWRVLVRLGIKGAWLAAAVWAIHPVQVESVAWAVERKNVLSGIFFFASLLAYTHFEPSLGAARRRWGFYILSIVLFTLALTSKATTSVLPAVILVLLWWKRGLSWKTVWPTLPMFAVGLASAALVASVEKSAGASGADFSFTFVQRVMIAGLDVWFYAWKLLVPHPLMPIYPRWNLNAYWQLVFFAAAVAVIVALWLLRKRMGRGPLAAVACFGVILSPALGFINFYTMAYTFVADHYQHLASAALIVLAVEAVRRGMENRVAPGARYVAAGIVLAVLGGLSFYNATHYRSNIALWGHNLRHNDSWITNFQLGAWTGSETKDNARAEALMRRSIELKDNSLARGLLAELLKDRDPAEAEKHARIGVTLGNVTPGSYLRLARLMEKQGRAQEANALLASLVGNYPNDPYVLFDAAGSCARLKMRREAIGLYERLLGIEPSHTRARYNLANQLLDEGRFADAVEHYRMVVSQEENADAWMNMGYAYFKMGRQDLAMAAKKKAEEIERGRKGK